MLITGRISDYPLPLLLEIFLHRRETGLLEISSPTESGYFCLKDGQLRVAVIGKLRGAEAVRFAGTLMDASFRFNSLPLAEYARLVWEKSFENLREGFTNSPRPREQASRLSLQQFSVYALAVWGSLEKAAVSTARRSLSYAKVSYEFAHKALPMRGWQIGSPLQQLSLLRERVFKYVPTQKLERALAFIRNEAKMLPPLNQEWALRRYSFTVITSVLLIATLVSISRQVKLRGNQAHTSRVRNAPAEMGIESQAQSTLVLSSRSAFVKARVPGRAFTTKANANDKGSQQRSTRQIPTEKNRDSNITKRSKSLRQEKTLRPDQSPTNPPADSAATKAKDSSTQAEQTISVRLLIENGRVSQASLIERRPGMEAYEATALRFARQRRYPAGVKRTDTVIVKVKKPNPD